MVNLGLSSDEEELFNDSVDEWIGQLTEDEYNSINLYTSYVYQDINNYLENHNSGILNEVDVKTHIKNISSGLKKFNYQGWLTVYRGISEIEYLKVLDSNEFKKFNSFKSTSLHFATANEFPEYLNDQQYLLIITLPPGTKGAYIDSITELEESEFLLDYRTSYKIIDNKTDDISGLNIIYLEVLV